MINAQRTPAVDLLLEISRCPIAVLHGWNSAKEFPLGIINAVHSRTETNEQNAKIGRHLALVATGLTQAAFCERVVERLLDSRTCSRRDCEACSQRVPRTLADAIQIFASGAKQREVHLFAKWSPSSELLDLLIADDVSVISHPLSDIPIEALEQNHFYHIWDGTTQQAKEFWELVWT